MKRGKIVCLGAIAKLYVGGGTTVGFLTRATKRQRGGPHGYVGSRDNAVKHKGGRGSIKVAEKKSGRLRCPAREFGPLKLCLVVQASEGGQNTRKGKREALLEKARPQHSLTFRVNWGGEGREGD